jgi:hypothetical protein
MHFKPFRPPLIRKNLASDVSSDSPNSDVNTPRPFKRPRLESKHDDEADNDVMSKPSDGNITRKSVSQRPLNSVHNSSSDGDTSTDKPNAPADDVEAYYNVLWLV